MFKAISVCFFRIFERPAMNRSINKKEAKKLYTHAYVSTQLDKFANRKINHWQHHISLTKRLVSEFAPKPPARMLDLGCSIGTFALEFALEGYETTGLDFDPKALEQAEILARELNCQPKWECQNASTFVLEEKVDFVVCFDLLEHLTDEMIKSMLIQVKRNLVDGGVFIFHTFPTEFDHVFYRNPLACLPLIPFRALASDRFEKIVRRYAKFLNVFYLLRYLKTHKKHIGSTVHPNPLSIERIKDFMSEVGFEILLLETGLDEINPLRNRSGRIAKKYFSGQTIAHRSIWGCARKKT